MPDKNNYLFVYGTLRRACASGAHPRFLATATLLGDGHTQGQLYRVDYYPGLIYDAQGIAIRGEIYAVTQTVLAQLDDYEGIGEHSPQPQEYRREKIPVAMDDGRYLSAWSYILNINADNLAQIQSGDWCLAAQQ